MLLVALSSCSIAIISLQIHPPPSKQQNNKTWIQHEYIIVLGGVKLKNTKLVFKLNIYLEVENK